MTQTPRKFHFIYYLIAAGCLFTAAATLMLGIQF